MNAPPPREAPSQAPGIEAVLVGRPRDLGGFEVARVLPVVGHRSVGPFVFFDHMGPAELAPGSGMDVRPHPHIGLATVTYLFEGEILHRDSLGNAQRIAPGEVNWMTAGRGIVHSERTPAELRARGSRSHGLQLWVALPTSHEEDAPSFQHHEAATLPTVTEGRVELRILAGSAYGATAPVATLSPLFYVEAWIEPGAGLTLPVPYEERAAYVVEGTVRYGDRVFEPRQMLVFAPGAAGVLTAETRARVMLVGGERLDGPRHVWWNFVSSSRERIEKAKADWKNEVFPKVPGDEHERTPLPE
jgi:redox-sensitive bicupin YhaK (pirin superfamily)